MSIRTTEELNAGIINTPMLWVNTYLQENLGHVLDIGVPFFPPSPNTIDDLTETFITLNVPSPDQTFNPDNITYPPRDLPYSGIRCTYDRLTRLRRSPFPHIKGEQLLYYFFATESNVTEQMVSVTEMVLRLMDREDETAEDINKWAKAKGNIAGLSTQFYFHKFRVYQLEEVADIIDFGTARTYGGNKIIIEYEYHQMPELTNP
mgnify:CR=1 FL=1